MDGFGEHIQVLFPPPALKAVVLYAIVRSVRLLAGAPVRAAQVHANPYGSINFVREGSIRLGAGERLPPAFLTGPLSRPIDTRVDANLYSVSVIVQPWALAAVTGAPIPRLVDQVIALPARGLAGAREAMVWLERRRSAMAPRVDELWSALERLLDRALRVEPPPLALESLRLEGVRAAARACRISERQYRRRFIAHMGLRPAAWARLTRLESVMAGMVLGPAALSDLAVDAGHADQAHLSRDARALLGRSPKAFQRTLHDGEADWPLRAAGPIFSRRGRGSDLPAEDELP